jgi:hypothetical protein
MLKAFGQHEGTSPISTSDYAFLLERFVDHATLHRAEELAKKLGVLPQAVMIAKGWLSASDYYRALARACGVPFRGELGPHEVTAPGSLPGRASRMPSFRSTPSSCRSTARPICSPRSPRR